jgi:hypothetical protein
MVIVVGEQSLVVTAVRATDDRPPLNRRAADLIRPALHLVGEALLPCHV